MPPGTGARVMTYGFPLEFARPDQAGERLIDCRPATEMEEVFTCVDLAPAPATDIVNDIGLNNAHGGPRLTSEKHK